jgi:hypothetical protein
MIKYLSARSQMKYRPPKDPSVEKLEAFFNINHTEPAQPVVTETLTIEQQIEQLAEVGCTIEEVLIEFEMTQEEFQKKYNHIYVKGYNKFKIGLRAAQYMQSQNPVTGATMARWLGIQALEQKDSKQVVESTNTNAEVQLTRAELVELLQGALKRQLAAPIEDEDDNNIST